MNLSRDQTGEVFRVICGSGFGFGTPFFVRHFLKHVSTRCKLGKRGQIEQCRTCENVYLDEADGTADWFAQYCVVAYVGAKTDPDGPERPAMLFPSFGDK